MWELLRKFFPSAFLPQATLRLHFISPGRGGRKVEIPKIRHFSTYFWPRMEGGARSDQIRPVSFAWFFCLSFTRMRLWGLRRLWGFEDCMRPVRGGHFEDHQQIRTVGSLVTTTASHVTPPLPHTNPLLGSVSKARQARGPTRRRR